VVNRTIGALIPEFRDLTGNVASIDSLFNRKFSQSGVFCAIDYKKVDMMDLTNSTFDSGSAVEPIAEQRIDLVGYGFDELNTTDPAKTLYTVDDGITGIDAVALIDTLSYRKSSYYDYYFKLDDVDYNSTYAAGETYTVDPGTGDKYIVATIGSKLYTAWANGFIKTGDTLTYLAAPSNTPTTLYLSTDGLVKTQNTGQIKYIEFYCYQDATLTNQVDAEYITDAGSEY
jgi:hypothetical protein